jgi:pimeloyl-ACP methyl ester carboxylesterase
VPASSFLYRKLLPELSRRGLRGIAWDLPGLGLAERPSDYDLQEDQAPAIAERVAELAGR